MVDVDFFNIGHKFIEKGEYQEAKVYLESNLAQIKEGGSLSPVTEVSMINMYVHLYYHLGDCEAVLKTYGKLMQMPKERLGAYPSSDRLTISMGIVNRKIPEDYRISEMVHEADEMLYEAKKSGKNN